MVLAVPPVWDCSHPSHYVLCPVSAEASSFSEVNTAIWENLWPKAILAAGWVILPVVFLSLPADGCPYLFLCNFAPYLRTAGRGKARKWRPLTWWICPHHLAHILSPCWVPVLPPTNPEASASSRGWLWVTCNKLVRTWIYFRLLLPGTADAIC